MIFYNRKKFFDAIRSTLPATHVLSSSQVAGFELLLKEGESRNVNTEWIAYVLATIWHETGSTMEPVRETFAQSDAQAIANLNRAYGSIKTGANRYWVDGWFGRGFIQLTWKYNYQKMGDWLGVDLIKNPDLALDPTIASKIAYEGMLRGMFTARKLSDYIDTTIQPTVQQEFEEFVRARAIINGIDKANLIAGYAMKIEDALAGSEEATAVSPASIPTVTNAVPSTVPVQTVTMPPSKTPVIMPPVPIATKSPTKSTTIWAALAIPVLTVIHSFQGQNQLVQGGIILASVAIAAWIISRRFANNTPLKTPTKVS